MNNNDNDAGSRHDDNDVRHLLPPNNWFLLPCLFYKWFGQEFSTVTCVLYSPLYASGAY